MADPKAEGTNHASNLKTLTTIASNSFVEENLDIPGILFFEHINMQVGSKNITRIFYQDILGMTPDPSPSFHYNIGQQQFHFMLAKNGEASHVVCGCIGISVPSLERVLFACKEVGQRLLLKTQFQILHIEEDFISIKGPYGNTFHIYQIGLRGNLGDESDDENETFMEKKHKMWDNGMTVRGQPGIKFIEWQVVNTKSVASFYQKYFGCNVYNHTHHCDKGKSVEQAVVQVGADVHFVFTENSHMNKMPVDLQRGIHVCVYVSAFKRSYHSLLSDRMIWTNPKFVGLDRCDTWEDAKAGRQYRFKDFLDPKSNTIFFELEHEVRSARHYQYLKRISYVPFVLDVNKNYTVNTNDSTEQSTPSLL